MPWHSIADYFAARSFGSISAGALTMPNAAGGGGSRCFRWRPPDTTRNPIMSAAEQRPAMAPTATGGNLRRGVFAIAFSDACCGLSESTGEAMTRGVGDDVGWTTATGVGE